MNLLRFESIRSICCESSLAKSNRHTGNLFTLGNNARWELFYWSELHASPHIHIWIGHNHVWIYMDKTIWECALYVG